MYVARLPKRGEICLVRGNTRQTTTRSGGEGGDVGLGFQVVKINER
jgi:hypothetical protein